MASGVFIFLFFFQVNFAHLQLHFYWQFVTCLLRLLNLKLYIRIGWSDLVFWKPVQQGWKWPRPKFSASEKFSTKSYWRKLIRQHRKFLGQTVEFDKHAYHAHTMAAYAKGIGAKSTLLDALLVSKKFGFFPWSLAEFCEEAKISTFFSLFTTMKEKKWFDWFFFHKLVEYRETSRQNRKSVIYSLFPVFIGILAQQIVDVDFHPHFFWKTAMSDRPWYLTD